MGSRGAAPAKQAPGRAPTPTPIASTAPATQPVPSRVAQAQAEKLIREVYLADYRQGDPVKRQALAAKLFQQGSEARGDAATRFVLLRESRDIAAAAGDAAGAAGAIEMLERDFGIETTPMSIAALTTAVGAARGPEAFVGIIRVAFAAADHAVGGDDYVAASRLMSLAASAAARVRDEQWVQQVRDRSQAVQAMAGEYDRVKAARSTLRTKGQDAECELIVGRYLCFIKSDFENGLSLLAGGSDSALREAAKAELARPGDASGMLKVGNLWWEIAESQNGLAKTNLRQHAGWFFRQAVGGLTGFDRSVAEKRLELLDAEEMQQRRLSPGLHADLFKGIDFAQKAGNRMDRQIDFEWALDAADPSLPKDNFSMRWSGKLRVRAGGRYELVAMANAGTRVWIDEQLVIDAPDIARQRSGVRRPVELSAGLHGVRIDYWDTTGTARMRLLWRPPGASRDEPIPSTSFYHEVGTDVSSAAKTP